MLSLKRNEKIIGNDYRWHVRKGRGRIPSGPVNDGNTKEMNKKLKKKECRETLSVFEWLKLLVKLRSIQELCGSRYWNKVLAITLAI